MSLDIMLIILAVSMAISLPITLSRRYKAAGVQGVLKYNLAIIFSSAGGAITGFLITVFLAAGEVTSSYPGGVYTQTYRDLAIASATLKYIWIFFVLALVGLALGFLFFYLGKKNADKLAAARYSQMPPAYGQPGQPPYGQPGMPYQPSGYAPQQPVPPAQAPYGQPQQYGQPGQAPYGQPQQYGQPVPPQQPAAQPGPGEQTPPTA